LEHLDDVVALIRQSKSPAEAKTGLMNRFGLTAIQAQAILDMRLQRLTGLEQMKILEEYETVLKDIARYKEILFLIPLMALVFGLATPFDFSWSKEAIFSVTTVTWASNFKISPRRVFIRFSNFLRPGLG